MRQKGCHDRKGERVLTKLESCGDDVNAHMIEATQPYIVRKK